MAFFSVKARSSAVQKSHLAKPQTHIVRCDMLTALLAEFEKHIVLLRQCRRLNVFNSSHLFSEWGITFPDREKLLIHPNSPCYFSSAVKDDYA